MHERTGASNEFDLIYRHQITDAKGNTITRFIVVEAKGGSSRLGSRMTGSGENLQRSQQGSVEYFVEIAQRMSEDPKLPADLRKVFQDITVAMGDESGLSDALAIARKKFDYLHIQQPIRADNSLAPVQISKFKLQKKKKDK